MNINIDFDDELIDRYKVKPSGSILMGIHLEHDEQFYPSDDWLDFGNVIIGWWSLSISEMLQGREGQGFDFMDGPFFIKGTIEGDVLHLKSEDGEFSCSVDKTDFASQVARAANKIARKFSSIELRELSENMNKCAKLIKDTCRT